uniref:Uncharacterized protein ORF930 n=1 Tax=Mycobacterium avium TaxID=1764 RepID=Q9RQS9_MYCAV|nr:unknown [Mycobacterium avium]
MTLSSRRSSGCGLVDSVVAQHGPQDVEAPAGQGEDGLGVGFAFGSFAVVVGPGCGVGTDGDLGGQVTGSQQSSVVAAGAFEIAADAPGIPRYRGQPDTPARRSTESKALMCGGGEELGAEYDAEAGHAQEDLGVAVAAKSVLDHRVGFCDFGVEGHHLLSQAGDHGGGEVLAGHGGVLALAGLDSRGRDSRGVAGLAFMQPSCQAGSAARAAVGGLVAGQQDQRGLAGAVIEAAFQGGEVLKQLGTQPVDHPGAIGRPGRCASGQDAQLDRDVITGSQRLQVAAHPSLVGDDGGVLGVAFAVATVAGRAW